MLLWMKTRVDAAQGTVLSRKVHIGATWRIQWNDLCGDGDADCSNVAAYSIMK